MGRRADGAGTLPEVRHAPLRLRSEAAETLRRVRQASVRVSERAVPGLRQAPVHLQEEAKRK